MIKLVKGRDNKISIRIISANPIGEVYGTFVADKINIPVPKSMNGTEIVLKKEDVDAIGEDFMIAVMNLKNEDGEEVAKVRVPLSILPEKSDNRGFTDINVTLARFKEVHGGHEGSYDYNDLKNKPSINGIVLIGDKTNKDLDLGSNDYGELDNKPSINDVTLDGNKTGDELGLVSKGLVERLVAKDIDADVPEDVKGYFYEADYGSLDDEFGYKYAAKEFSQDSIGACTSVRSGDFYGRNYDWKYDEKVTFIVRVPGDSTRHASMAICSDFTGAVTKDRVLSRSVTAAEWKSIPYHALDGINDSGVLCSMNVVHSDVEREAGWKKQTDAGAICGTAMVRYVLDHATSAREGAEMIAAKAWMPNPDKLGGYSLHYMVADGTETWIVEDGYARNVSDFGVKAMANFRCFDVTKTTSESPTAYSFTWNATGDIDLNPDIGLASYDKYGTGIERYKKVINAVAEAAPDGGLDEDGMKELMESIRYSEAYRSTGDPSWPSEFAGVERVGGGSLMTVDEVEAQKEWYSHYDVHNRWEARTRNEEYPFWQTVHSSVYDIANKTLTIRTQENFGKEYVFKLSDMVWCPFDMKDVPLADSIHASTAQILDAVKRLIVSMRGR